MQLQIFNFLRENASKWIVRFYSNTCLIALYLRVMTQSGRC